MKLGPLEFTLPPTTTVLALGFLTGNLMLMPMFAWLGKDIPSDYREGVKDVVGLFKDGMLLILGFYFAKVVNAGTEQTMARQDRVAETLATTQAKTTDALAQLAGAGPPPPAQPLEGEVK